MNWLLALILIYRIFFAKELLYPIFIALYLAEILQPLVHGLNRIRIPSLIGAALSITFLLSMFFVAVAWFSAPAGEWLDRAPKLIQEAEYKLYDLKMKIREARQTTDQLGGVGIFLATPIVVTILITINKLSWLEPGNSPTDNARVKIE